eukprot:m.75778 g.75778  ORF g.75778 m.75778 type:complete len:305 (+) comp24827_c0_seq1:515-1429(+)
MGNICQGSRDSPSWKSRLPRRSRPPSRTSPNKAYNSTGELYVALYNHHPTEEGKLSFNKGDAILVTKMIDRFTCAGRVQGTTEEGVFPTTYAKKQEEEVDMSPVPSNERGMAGVEYTDWNPKAKPKRSIVKGSSRQKSGNRSVMWPPVGKEVAGFCDAFAKAEYERGGDFDPHHASSEWESEEEEEKVRQMFVLWEHLEKDLEPGQKCEERRKFEIEAQNKALEIAREKELRRAEFAEKRRLQKNGVTPAAAELSRDDKLQALRLARTKRGDTVSIRGPTRENLSSEDLTKRMLEQTIVEDAEC